MTAEKVPTRFRVSAKQTAKGLWYLDATAEAGEENLAMTTDKNDLGNTATSHLGLRLLSLIKETEKHFRTDGRSMVTDG